MRRLWIACLLGASACGGAAIPPTSTPSIKLDQGAFFTGAAETGPGAVIEALGPKQYRVFWFSDPAGDNIDVHGSLWTRGHFLTVIPGCANQACAVEDNDSVSSAQSISGGQRVDFDTQVSTGIDGVDVTVDTEPLYFDITLGGAHVASDVFCSSGGQQVSPASLPFGFTSE